ncbi:MAG: CBS domain-containing protein [Cryomorphaceae bacterium]
MSEPVLTESVRQRKRAEFIRHLLNDVRALEYMLDKNLIEADTVRIGAEQEFCLVNANWRPSLQSAEILEGLADEHFTTELARYNIELNLDPLILADRCFSQVEASLNGYLNKADSIAAKLNDKVVLTGILPTISKSELGLEYMTPNPRYLALNEVICNARGAEFELHIKGIDELSVRHPSVLFEACNTSFQMHLQIPPDDFIPSYNWAQAISGPTLGICANSPLLLGRELWSETRIALFQQSIDTRVTTFAVKDQIPRVNFGHQWEDGSVVDIFKNSIAKFKVIMSREIEHDALVDVENGLIPKLQALSLHNSTVYRWNRPCYGITDGKPHLRIENRYLPAGPTTMDEVANFAFWVGMMKGRPAAYDDMNKVMEFRDAKSNFIKASRTGKESVMRWKGEQLSVRDLVIQQLIPIARKGLQSVGISADDISRYLGIIEHRANGKTGAQWIIENYRTLRKNMKRDDALLALTKAIHTNQRSDMAVSKWLSVDADVNTHDAAFTVEHVMSTDLFSVNENDSAELAINVMDWNEVHHIPVEDDQSRLVGILTSTHLNRFKLRGGRVDDALVKDVMIRSVITAQIDTEIQEAIRIMKKHEIGSLPVVHENHLLGIVTIEDVKAFDRE